MNPLGGQNFLVREHTPNHFGVKVHAGMPGGIRLFSSKEQTILYRSEKVFFKIATFYQNSKIPVFFSHKKCSPKKNYSSHCDTKNDSKKGRKTCKMGPPVKRSKWSYLWVFPKIGVPQNGWFIMENPIKIDDLGAPLFLETPKKSLYMAKNKWLSLGLFHPYKVELHPRKRTNVDLKKRACQKDRLPHFSGDKLYLGGHVSYNPSKWLSLALSITPISGVMGPYF